jgi:transposase InsO family protein
VVLNLANHAQGACLSPYRARRRRQTQFSKPIKAFRSDNALEYTQHDFQAILKHYGTIPHLSCPGTSQKNGRAERKLRHILDTVRALLLSLKS